MPDTVLIIPVHNRRETTLKCLRCLQARGDLISHDCLVVDDGSTDGTAAAIAAEFPRVVVRRGDGNLWWTGAMRLGMAEAFGERRASTVVWLNDDCLPEQGAIDRLVAVVQTDADVAGPACYGEDGRAVASGFVGRHLIAIAPDEVKAVNGLSGYCVAVSRRSWEKIGAPDPVRFPHYYGDTAYTLQASRAGLRVTLAGQARIQLQAYDSPPLSPGAMRRGYASWREAWRHAFLSKKSRFRWRTQWHYLRLKYGPVGGSILACGRAAVWQVRFFLGA